MYGEKKSNLFDIWLIIMPDKKNMNKILLFFEFLFLTILLVIYLSYQSLISKTLLKNVILPATSSNNYNDTTIMLQEADYFQKNTEFDHFRWKNFWHATKVRITSSPWKLCPPDTNLTAFIYLWTRVYSFGLRDTIRKTWASRSLFPSVNVAFILGMSQDRTVNKNVSEENKKYGDIIQGDFVDAYRNLSFKSLIQWRWSKYNYKKVRYFLKMDYDMILNTRELIRFLNNRTIFNPNKRLLFAGGVLSRSEAIRDTSSKCYVTRDEWPDPYYKPYCNGPAYIMSRILPAKLYNVSFTTRDL